MIKKTLIALALSQVALFAGNVYATFDVEAMKESKLTLSVSGVVNDLHVKVGDRVKKGQLLLKLDDALEKADAVHTKSELALAKIAEELAQRNFKRYQKIKDVIDEEQYENVEFQLKTRQAEMLRSQKAYDLKNVMVEKRSLMAPYGGIISATHVEVGDGVSGASTPLVSIVSTPDVKLVLSFDEKYWKDVKVGHVFKYRVDGVAETLEGKIGKVYPTVDATNRKLKAEVYTQGILPGLFGDGEIIAE